MFLGASPTVSASLTYDGSSSDSARQWNSTTPPSPQYWCDSPWHHSPLVGTSAPPGSVRSAATRMSPLLVRLDCECCTERQTSTEISSVSVYDTPALCNHEASCWISPSRGKCGYDAGTTPATMELWLHSPQGLHSSPSIIYDAEEPLPTDMTQQPTPTANCQFSSGQVPPAWQCCNNQCLKYFALVDVEHARSLFDTKSSQEQNQFLLDLINMHTKSSSSKAICTLNGKYICQQALCFIYNISAKRIKRLCKQAKTRAVKTTRLRTIRCNSIKTSEGIAWLARYFDRIGDKMPLLNQTHLPRFLTKGDIYKIMLKELKMDRKMETISLSHFYLIWKKNFNRVVIPAVSSQQLYCIHVHSLYLCCYG